MMPRSNRVFKKRKFTGNKYTAKYTSTKGYITSPVSSTLTVASEEKAPDLNESNSSKPKHPPNLDELLKMSKDVRKHSYAPYSKFTVGAALVCEDDTIYTGCNVENAAYSMAICAERTAMVKAVSEGHRKFKTIVINSSLQKVYTSPCGACRQFMAEFGLDWDVYMTKEDLSYKKATVGELLPEAFGPFTLKDHFSSSQKD